MRWWEILLLSINLLGILLNAYADLFVKDQTFEKLAKIVYVLMILPITVLIIWSDKWWSLAIGILFTLITVIIIFTLIYNLNNIQEIRKKKASDLQKFGEYLIDWIERSVIRTLGAPPAGIPLYSRHEDFTLTIRNFEKFNDKGLMYLPHEMGGTGNADTLKYLINYIYGTIIKIVKTINRKEVIDIKQFRNQNSYIDLSFDESTYIHALDRYLADYLNCTLSIISLCNLLNQSKEYNNLLAHIDYAVDYCGLNKNYLGKLSSISYSSVVIISSRRKILKELEKIHKTEKYQREHFENPVCLSCSTEYNRGVVIELLQQVDPDMFELQKNFTVPTFSTSFKCKKCGANVPITIVRQNTKFV